MCGGEGEIKRESTARWRGRAPHGGSRSDHTRSPSIILARAAWSCKSDVLLPTVLPLFVNVANIWCAIVGVIIGVIRFLMTISPSLSRSPTSLSTSCWRGHPTRPWLRSTCKRTSRFSRSRSCCSRSSRPRARYADFDRHGVGDRGSARRYAPCHPAHTKHTHSTRTARA